MKYGKMLLTNNNSNNNNRDVNGIFNTFLNTHLKMFYSFFPEKEYPRGEKRGGGSLLDD
jgi:hypothetical protein